MEVSIKNNMIKVHLVSCKDQGEYLRVYVFTCYITACICEEAAYSLIGMLSY